MKSGGIDDLAARLIRSVRQMQAARMIFVRL